MEHLHPVTGQLVSPAIFYLKSIVWPGFHLFYKENQIFKIYIGSGQKYQEHSFFPKLTHNIQEDPEDLQPMEEFKAPEKPVNPEEEPAE